MAFALHTILIIDISLHGKVLRESKQHLVYLKVAG